MCTYLNLATVESAVNFCKNPPHFFMLFDLLIKIIG